MGLESDQVSPGHGGILISAPNRAPLHAIVWGAPNPRKFTMRTHIAREGLKGRFQLLVAFGTEFACYEADAVLDATETAPVGGTVHTDHHHEYENWHYDIRRLDGFKAFVAQLQYSSSRSGVPLKHLLSSLRQKNLPVVEISSPRQSAPRRRPFGGPRLNTASNLINSPDHHVSHLLNRDTVYYSDFS